MPCMRSRVQTEVERRRREAGIEQSMKIRSYPSVMYVDRYVGGLVFGIISRTKLRYYVAQQMRYQNVGLSNWHCLGNRHHYNFSSLSHLISSAHAQ